MRKIASAVIGLIGTAILLVLGAWLLWLLRAHPQYAINPSREGFAIVLGLAYAGIGCAMAAYHLWRPRNSD